MTAEVLIIGGRGFIGKALAVALRDAGLSVAIAGRAELSAQPPADLMKDCRILINCAGLIADRPGNRMAEVHADLPGTLLAAARAAGVRRFIHLSALGADTAAAGDYFRTKGTAEATLMQHSGLPEVCLLRPSLVIGRGGASTDLFSALAALPLPPRLGPGDWQVQPVHIDDLAALVVRLATAAEAPPRRLDVVGPHPMTTDALTLCLRRWLDLPERPFLPLPAALLRLTAPLLGAMTGLPASRETITMLAAGNCGDAAPITQALGRPPRALPEALARHPATAADRWRAKLFLVAPLLRLSLAFLWIITALLSFGLYPIGKSLALMAPLGLTGTPAMIALIVGGAADLLLGLMLLLRLWPVMAGLGMLCIMAGYTLLITALPLEDFWLHPFAPILKNIPIGAAILAMMALEGEKRR
jgi:uncharacterized protein YbjT (DUF2867 family)/uncharacterized membrane protein YphA (DoxX/SURF4 family)